LAPFWARAGASEVTHFLQVITPIAAFCCGAIGWLFGYQYKKIEADYQKGLVEAYKKYSNKLEKIIGEQNATQYGNKHESERISRTYH
jgi:hypothetical protein